MGCHTWFSVPIVTAKKEILKLAKQELKTTKHITNDWRLLYEYAIKNEICEPVCELASNANENLKHIAIKEWVLYKDVTKWSIDNYNKKNNTNLNEYDYESFKKCNIETYNDAPRIGGYPDMLIKSYNEMKQAIKDGFTNNEEKKHEFRFENNEKEVMEGIERFFKKHKGGIITFG